MHTLLPLLLCSAAPGVAPTWWGLGPSLETGSFPKESGKWEDKGTLWKLKLQINSERVSGVLFGWFWSRV